jgi:hypothetical protein
VKFSRSYSRAVLLRSGPKIKVTISHPLAVLNAAALGDVEVAKPLTVTALIDTGASRTVINPEVAATCGLKHIGEVRISSAGHITERREFVGALSFPDSELGDLILSALLLARCQNKTFPACSGGTS